MTTGSPYPTAPPPPPPPLNYPPPAVGYAPLGARLTAVKVMFAVIAGVSALAALSDLFEILLLDRLIAGEQVSDSELDANDARQAIAGVVQFGTWIGCAIVFIMWLHRAYHNVDAVAPRERRYGHGWAIGSWFVPFLNLWRPKQIVNDVWRAGGDTRPSLLLAAWWTMWIITNWLANIGLRRAFSDETPEELRTGSIAYMVTDLLDIPTAILAILVAGTLTRRLDARAAEMPPPPPQPVEGHSAAPVPPRLSDGRY